VQCLGLLLTLSKEIGHKIIRFQFFFLLLLTLLLSVSRVNSPVSPQPIRSLIVSFVRVPMGTGSSTSWPFLTLVLIPFLTTVRLYLTNLVRNPICPFLTMSLPGVATSISMLRCPASFFLIGIFIINLSATLIPPFAPSLSLDWISTFLPFP
jgi:hypothetical protein